MAFTLRRSARTIFMTSSTSAVAFLACYFSPIMKIQAFGIFSAVLVFVTFLLTCMVFPPAIAFYEGQGQFCTFCWRRQKRSDSERRVTKITKIPSADSAS